MKRKYNRSGGDPRQITARFSSDCIKCGCRIQKGEQFFYWPNGSEAYCYSCGEPLYRQFLSSKADEEVYHRVGNPF